MAKHVETVDELVEALRKQDIRQVVVSGKIATATTPGGEQIAFRGRLVVTAETPSGEGIEYVEHVMPYIAATKSAQIPATADTAQDLRAAQSALARQLRAYRGEYRGVVGAARDDLAARLRDAGVDVREPED